MQVMSSMVAGRWISTSGRYGGTIRFGISLVMIASLSQMYFAQDTHPAFAISVLTALGIGLGAANQPMVVAMQAHVKKSERAVIISARSFSRFFGSAVGVAASSAIMQWTLRRVLPLEFRYLANQPYALGNLDPVTREIVTPAYESAMKNVFIGMAAISICCCIALLGWHDNGYDSQPPESTIETPQEAQTDEESPIAVNDTTSRPAYGTISATDDTGSASNERF
jgi:hypothetical protein